MQWNEHIEAQRAKTKLLLEGFGISTENLVDNAAVSWNGDTIRFSTEYVWQIKDLTPAQHDVIEAAAGFRIDSAEGQ